MTSPVDAAVNPNNSAQRLILWGNGRIDSVGGVPPVVNNTQWYHRTDQPAQALHVTDWVKPSGYVLDFRGGFQPFGDAPDLGLDSSNPQVVQGVPYTGSPNVRRYVDWSWDPSGSGQGYVLDSYGQLHAFGGATAPPRAGGRFSSKIARKLEMQWSPTKRAITVTMYGGMYGDFGATIAAHPQSLGMIRWDAIRDLQITNWATGGGYMLDLYGGVHRFGGAPEAAGFPYSQGGDQARVLRVVSSADPVRFWEVWAGGQQYEWVSSTPPTVVAGGEEPVSPAVTETDTTRPTLSWSYADPQGDRQTQAQALVFTEAFAAGHSMTDPLVWRDSAVVAREVLDANARGILCPVDLPNGGYRLYVRAKDSANQWSAWDSHAWTQDVPVPSAPTGLSATADPAACTVALSVSANTAENADLIRFEASDDGVTWVAVRGASAVPLVAVTVAVDYDIPLGVTRTYRAVAYATDPAVASPPSGTDTAWVPPTTYRVGAVSDPEIGGELAVQDPVEWARPVTAGVFYGLGADYPTVVGDGAVKARKTVCHVLTETRAEWDKVAALLRSRSTLVYRDPFGEVIYCRLSEEVRQQQLLAAPSIDENTPLGHFHTVQLPLVEVRPPHLDG